MRTKLLCVAFSRELGRFDDSELASFLANREITSFREHVVDVDGEPFLLCVVTWHEESPAAAQPASTTTQPARPMPQVLQGLTDEQRALYEMVRRWRAKKAHDEGAPPYVILTNRQLAEIVQARPNTRAGLGRIDGIGEKKLDRYADDLLALLWPPIPAAEPAAPTAEVAS